MQLFKNSRFVVIVIFFITLLLGGTNLFASDATTILSQLQFSLVKSPVSDFKLKSLKGGEISLSKYRGKWIFINFWATWCGPCRYEMPKLEDLSQKLKGENIQFLGVSIDRGNVGEVKKFIKSSGITFPILLDSSNSAASTYQSSSVPSIYVISPDWKLVGIFKGAKDWSKFSEEIRRLSKFNEVKGAVGPSGSVVIPNKLASPVLKLILDKKSYLEGDEFFVELSVKWSDNTYSYQFGTPELIVPTGVIVGKITSETSSGVLGSTLRYQFPIISEIDGDIKIGPVELMFKPRSGGGDGEELFARASEINIHIEKPVYKKTFFIILFFVGVSIFGLIFLLIIIKIRKNITLNNDIKGEVSDNLFKRLDKLKIEGSLGRDYQVELLKSYLIVCENTTEHVFVKTMVEKVEFAGVELSAVKIEYYEKLIDKYKNKKMED